MSRLVLGSVPIERCSQLAVSRLVGRPGLTMREFVCSPRLAMGGLASSPLAIQRYPQFAVRGFVLISLPFKCYPQLPLGSLVQSLLAIQRSPQLPLGSLVRGPQLPLGSLVRGPQLPLGSLVRGPQLPESGLVRSPRLAESSPRRFPVIKYQLDEVAEQHHDGGTRNTQPNFVTGTRHPDPKHSTASGHRSLAEQGNAARSWGSRTGQVAGSSTVDPSGRAVRRQSRDTVGRQPYKARLESCRQFEVLAEPR